jgi:hypothetical protein
MAGATVLAVATGAPAAPQHLGAPVRATLRHPAPADVARKEDEPSFTIPVDTEVVGSTSLPRPAGDATSRTEPPDPADSLAPESQGRLRLNGQKYASPAGARTEAGVGLSLGSHVSIQVNYARTASVPMMAYANDNGVLARLRIGF